MQTTRGVCSALAFYLAEPFLKKSVHILAVLPENFPYFRLLLPENAGTVT
jgi:hypothetical protein